MGVIWFLLIGIVAGYLAGLIMKGSGFGLLWDLIIGVIGAFIGGFLFSLAGIGLPGGFGELVTALVGAIVLLLIVKLVRRRG